MAHAISCDHQLSVSTELSFGFDGIRVSLFLSSNAARHSSEP
jgi:hypothetical protein